MFVREYVANHMQVLVRFRVQQPTDLDGQHEHRLSFRILNVWIDILLKEDPPYIVETFAEAELVYNVTRHHVR